MGSLAGVLVTLLGLLGPLPAFGSPALSLVASIQPLALIAREVAGDRAVVSVLVPPGATPHAFEPRPGDVARLARADLLVSVGGGLDTWTERLLAAAPRAPEQLAAAELPGMPEVGRPHVWLDPLSVRDVLVPALAERLARLDPDGAPRYAERSTTFAGRLGALDREIRALLAPADTRAYVAFHAAWLGFAKRYGLHQVGVIEPFPGAEPSPKHLARLVADARSAGVHALLVEPQLDPRTARTLAAEFGATTVLVDPLGDPDDPERADYEGLLRFNARAFAQALVSRP